MRKLTAIFIVSLLVLLAFSIGCSKEESKSKVVASRPVTAKSVGTAEKTTETAPAAQESAPVESTEVASEETTASESSSPAGTADCDKLAGTDIAAVFGGAWTKTSDCPSKPAMPKGVSVCMCAYDGPKQVYVNIETQSYDSATEALRVYNMYCKGATEQNEVGEKSCRQNRSSTLTPNFVFFLKGSNFVKVSCLGGTCKLDGVAMIATKVAETV